jgi:hypothetical protein
METGKHRPVLGPVEVEATCRFESCLQRVTILKHIDPNDCLGRLTIVQQCALIWYGVTGKHGRGQANTDGHQRSNTLAPHSWQNLTGIASATDYSNAGSNPATILQIKGTICSKRMKRETR